MLDCGKKLLCEFKPLSELDNYKLQLNCQGLYAIGLKQYSVITILFKNEIVKNQTNLIYIGVSTKNSLFKRIEQECRGKSNGTFFRGVGALLGFRPPKGSLYNKKNHNNYQFSNADKKCIIAWMNKNLNFNYININEINDILIIEKQLVSQNCPILNTTHNPQKSKYLANLRKECRELGLKDN